MKKILVLTSILLLALTALVLSGCDNGEEAHAHQMGNWVVDTQATCTQEGSKHLPCATCGETMLTDTISKTAHTNSDWVVEKAATCTEDGSRYVECTVCKTKIMTDTVNATGHTEGNWVVDTEATNKTDGSKHKSCTVCNETLTTEVIPAKGVMGDTELANYVTERTVAIYVDGSKNGTGFFISENGILVTNFHVLDNVFYDDVEQKSIQVQLTSGGTYDLEYMIKFDPAYDLAVLKIDLGDKKVPYLEIATEEATKNTTVYACGYALALDDTNFTEGKISATNDTFGLSESYVHTAPISGGNSGGPLVNGYGELVGINAGGYANGDNMYLAIKVSQLDKLRFTGEKNLSEFLRWHSMETRDSMNVYLVDSATSQYNELFYRSYIHTYHDESGATCLYSSNQFGAAAGQAGSVNGYDAMKYYYTYRYEKSQYTSYVEYLKSEGYEYKENMSGVEADIYTDFYYSEVDKTYIEFITYTNVQGERVIQVDMYAFE